MKRKHLILPLAAMTLIFVACDKASEPSGDEGFDRHPTWTNDNSNNFWEKLPNDGFQIDTAWDGDTTIYFKSNQQ